MKALGIVGAVMIAYAAGNYLLQRHFVLHEFRQLERESAQRDHERADEAVERELESVETMASDWGNWTEIHAYMVSHDATTPERDLSVSAMDGLGVDYVALVDTTGQIIWSRSLHPRTHTAVPPPPVASTVLVTWSGAMREGQKRVGMIRTDLGAMMVAVAPILNGEGGGPWRGSLILGRYYTTEVLDELAHRTKLDLRFTMLPESAPVPGGPDSLVLEQADHLELTHVFTDIAGVALLQQTVRVPRDLLARGKSTVQLAAVSILVAALMSLLVLVLLLRRLVLKPLTRVAEHVQRIGSTDDLTQRMHVHSDDEIGRLAAGIDSMVGKLQEARSRLVERSYEAGAAEMVRGTLHNVGNALTPMAVHSAGIAASLKAAPLADLALALRELGAAAGDEQRATQLQRFALLAVEETTTHLAEASRFAEELQRGVDTLQDLLRLQMNASRGEQVTDRVNIATTLEEALRLCPPECLQRVHVQVADALRELQPERLPVMLLKQVFQNLIINAAEAMPAGQPGVISVTGARIEESAGTWMELSFSDNGSGITPEALGSIFEQGFSTKSSKRNAGIGLHWCANALASVGGSIRASSRGQGHGATFTVLVPLEMVREQAA